MTGDRLKTLPHRSICLTKLFHLKRLNNPSSLKSFILKNITENGKVLQYQQKYYSAIFHNKTGAHKSTGILDFLQLSTLHPVWLSPEPTVCKSLESEVIKLEC